MKKTIANQDSPVVLGVVRERTADEAISAIKNCKIKGATAIDLHLSCLTPENRTSAALKRIVNSTSLPILAVNYNQDYDRRDSGMTEEERLVLLRLAVEAGCAGADMQGYTYDLSAKVDTPNRLKGCPHNFAQGDPREIVVDEEIIEKQKAFIKSIHDIGGEVLLSNHPAKSMTTEQLLDWIRFLEERNPDIIKIVTVADTEEELAEVIRAMIMIKKEIKTPVSLHASGKFGALSRIICPILGGHIIFCVDNYVPYDDHNQLDVATAYEIIKNVKKQF